jgi:hypothetical protein
MKRFENSIMFGLFAYLGSNQWLTKKEKCIRCDACFAQLWRVKKI